MMALAPSSPRLPSPPPAAEIQLGPMSPSAAAPPQVTQIEQNLLDANSKRRIHPGTKAADMAPGPPVVPLEKLDSPFQLQEHLSALHNHLTQSSTVPLDRSSASSLAICPEGIDRTLWLYELCRFLISHCNTLIVGFLFDSPPCSATTCPEMRASEWQFLCAVHETPKSCCAIDYCCHTLDWAANVVTDQKIFPSRFMVANDPASKNNGLRNLVNVFRRLHRIFAHAWFQHRDIFWQVEGQSGLYVFFKAVCDTYDLLPAENYKLPPEAEGLESPSANVEAEKPTPVILKNDTHSGAGGRNSAFGLEDSSFQPPSRTNTRRHIRASPSTGSAVTTVMETEEEESNNVAKRIKELSLSGPETVEEEQESADVPMMVEVDDGASEADQTVVEFAEDPEEMPTSRAEVARPTVGVEEASAETPESEEAAPEEPTEETPAVAEANPTDDAEKPADEENEGEKKEEGEPKKEDELEKKDEESAKEAEASADAATGEAEEETKEKDEDEVKEETKEAAGPEPTEEEASKEETAVAKEDKKEE